jgi:hypothetical protein
MREKKTDMLFGGDLSQTRNFVKAIYDGSWQWTAQATVDNLASSGYHSKG